MNEQELKTVRTILIKDCEGLDPLYNHVEDFPPKKFEKSHLSFVFKSYMLPPKNSLGYHVNGDLEITGSIEDLMDLLNEELLELINSLRLSEEDYLTDYLEDQGNLVITLYITLSNWNTDMNPEKDLIELIQPLKQVLIEYGRTDQAWFNAHKILAQLKSLMPYSPYLL
jgi:hypothetical protein